MRISEQQRRQTERRIRAAAHALLAGDIPADGKCDITTLARKAGVSRAALYRSYPQLKDDFERQLTQRRAQGHAPDPRDAQILRLKNKNAHLNDRLAAQQTALTELTEFNNAALSRLAAQHDEITRLCSDASAHAPVRRLSERRQTKTIGPCS